MGLDFGLRRKRIDPGFEGMNWETLWSGRNCHQVRDIIYSVIHVAPNIDCSHIKVGIGTLALIVQELPKYIIPMDIIDADRTSDNTVKLLDAICGLTDALHSIAFDNVWEDDIPHYEYEFYDSF